MSAAASSLVMASSLLPDPLSSSASGLAQELQPVPLSIPAPAAPAPEATEAPTTSSTADSFLRASPYTAPAHLLDLRTLSPPLQSLARALTNMAPLTPAYATTPYASAFNWDAIVSSLPASFPGGSFYVIVFRSQLPVGTDRTRLGELDAQAHREAVRSGGLLKYWFGTPDAQGRNLATCLWRNRDDARKGGAGPGHAEAMREARGIYVEWRVERFRLDIDAGGKVWRIGDWVD